MIEDTIMLLLTIFVFALAALMGVILIWFLLRNKNTPKGLAIIHGTTAGIGILLLVAVLFTSQTKPYLSLAFFILAAIGGFTMMYRDIFGKSLPKWLAVGHGLIAVVGFVLLLMIFF